MPRPSQGSRSWSGVREPSPHRTLTLSLSMRLKLRRASQPRVQIRGRRREERRDAEPALVLDIGCEARTCRTCAHSRALPRLLELLLLPPTSTFTAVLPLLLQRRAQMVPVRAHGCEKLEPPAASAAAPPAVAVEGCDDRHECRDAAAVAVRVTMCQCHLACCGTSMRLKLWEDAIASRCCSTSNSALLLHWQTPSVVPLVSFLCNVSCTRCLL